MRVAGQHVPALVSKPCLSRAEANLVPFFPAIAVHNSVVQPVFSSLPELNLVWLHNIAAPEVREGTFIS